ncbi:hypothetical protein J2X46_000942 [Nocardioides sp. BE266]|uniref:hypothetical protein n=1 Tax=Nocardioides sp. BE266 TaxID=2817725 RepID=UPI00285D29F2|nr:hypothetical protein [Nocardioides sp. BE266]MDR7251966.1 hypothetical protein [Nocardioides sp. BE266]
MAPTLPVRHRRVLTYVGLVAALVIGILAWSAVAATRDEPNGSGASSSASPSAAATVVRIPRHLKAWLEAVPGSDLPEPRAGVTVLDRVDAPDELADAIGLSLETDGDARWVLAVRRTDGELVTYSEVPAQSRWLTFDQWRTDLVLQEEGAPGLVLASVGDDGVMIPIADGAEVVDQAVDRDHRMGAFRERRHSVFAVALVRWEGEKWFVMSERYDDQSRSTAIAARRTGTTATTAEEFIAQYSELGKRP